MVLALQVYAVVEAAPAVGRIDDEARWLGRWLQRVVDGRPMYFGLALSRQHDIDMVGGERRDDVRHLVHAGDISQQDLVDASRQVEAEVRVLSETHVCEVLVRHGLDDGAGHARHAALGVVAVVEFAPLPLVVDVLHVVGDDGE